jgi:hypothetical protein
MSSRFTALLLSTHFRANFYSLRLVTFLNRFFSPGLDGIRTFLNLSDPDFSELVGSGLVNASDPDFSEVVGSGLF